MSFEDTFYEIEHNSGPFRFENGIYVIEVCKQKLVRLKLVPYGLQSVMLT